MTYKIQIDDLERNANAKEIAIFEALQNKKETELAELEAKQVAKAALLERLGITADEAALLLQ